MKTRQVKQRRYPPEERRALILQAARRCISEHGIERATARKIAALSGISPGTLTHHFPSMDELLVEALRSGSEELTDAWLRRLKSRSGALERLHSVIESSLPDNPKALTMWRLWLEYWSRAARDPALSLAHTERYRVLRGAFEAIIADGVASGEFRPVDPRQTAREFVGLFDGLGVQATVGDEELGLREVREVLRGWIEARLLSR